MKNRTKKIAYLGLMTAVALILSYVESLFPPLIAAVPGIKMGLPNIVIIFILYRFGFKEAAVVSAIRVFTVALLFGNMMSLAYSVAGAALSLILMVLIKRTGKFSAVGVSVVGGISHNLGQVLMAMLLLETAQIGYYMIVLTVSGTIAGVFIGLAGSAMLKHLKDIKL